MRGPQELRACQALQRRTWGITEDGYLLPVATMAGVQVVGGLVLGAFRGQDLVGFCFAFHGRLRGRPILYSQLAAVDPPWQGGGVGRLLKLEQRRRAAEQGLEAVVWAFDPLQAGNAAFNLATLGAVSHTYEVDLYGPRTDDINRGLATDRLLAEWPTREEPRPVEAPAGAADLIAVEGGRPVAVRSAPTNGGPARIEIPKRIAEVAAADRDLAHTWQRAVRDAFQGAFAAGYVAVGFQRGDRLRYVLERRCARGD